MSGIYGLIKNNNSKIDMPNFERLRKWNEAYGRNGFNEVKQGNVIVGCFLEKIKSDAIIGEPVLSRNNKLWAIDAVIYNKHELENEFNKDFSDLSDEEIIVYLLEEEGWDILSKINGDFAGAVYDLKDNILKLFRDHMGIRPLYYYASDEFICFSTDIRGVLSVDQVDVTISKLWAYNAYLNCIDYSDTSTEYEKIFCVRPASVLTLAFNENISKGKRKKPLAIKDITLCNLWDEYRESFKYLNMNEKKYWYLGDKKIRYKTEEEYILKMRELVEDSVRIRLAASDGIVGSEFSGGLDSSLLSILINKMGREGKYISWSLDPKVHPYQKQDERRIIEEICEREGISCKFVGKNVDFSTGDEFNKSYSEVVDTDNEQPPYEKYVFWPMINTYELFSSANYVQQNGGKVVFTGHGGDEGVSHRTGSYEVWNNREYGNYFKFYFNMVEAKNFKALRAIKWGIKDIFRIKGVIDKQKKTLDEVRNQEEDYWEIINRDFLQKYRLTTPMTLEFSTDPKSFILKGGSRVRLDNVAMYGAFCNVRYMLPYLDYRLIDYAVSIERYMYIKNNNKRYILKEAFRDILPESLLGEIDKSDPSFENYQVQGIPFEEQIQNLKNRIQELKNDYDLSCLNEIYSVDKILEELHTKDINTENYGELSRKCVSFFYAVRAVIAIKRAR